VEQIQFDDKKEIFKSIKIIIKKCSPYRIEERVQKKNGTQNEKRTCMGCGSLRGRCGLG
jgi:hypothetical protein